MQNIHKCIDNSTMFAKPSKLPSVTTMERVQCFAQHNRIQRNTMLANADSLKFWILNFRLWLKFFVYCCCLWIHFIIIMWSAEFYFLIAHVASSLCSDHFIICIASNGVLFGHNSRCWCWCRTKFHVFLSHFIFFFSTNTHTPRTISNIMAAGKQNPKMAYNPQLKL